MYFLLTLVFTSCVFSERGLPAIGSEADDASNASDNGGGSSTSTEETVPTCEKDGDVLDLRPEFHAAPEGGIEIRSPYIEVPPFTQAFWCYWGTYTGPTTGVTHYEPIQSDGYDHHSVLRAVHDEGEEDEYMGVCPPSDDMYDYGPLIEATGIEPSPDIRNWLEMPNGIAMKLKKDQKWVLDMHYINPTGCTLLVQNGINLGLLPSEEVEHWAAPLRLDGGIIELPPQETTSVEFDCEWPQDLNVLTVGSHMHEYGTRYDVDYFKADGSKEDIYTVDPWEPEYRDFPVMVNFPDGGLAVREGEVFRTSCNWKNTTDELIGYPDEMCTTFVSAYPLEEPITCMLGEWVNMEAN